jgi:hypothetical protein
LDDRRTIGLDHILLGNDGDISACGDQRVEGYVMPFPIDLIRQVRQAYLDAPGLSLTPAQIGRLLAADHDDCRVALAALVDTGLLTLRGDQYVRTITGELPPGEAMRLRAAPWDCRWAEPVLYAGAPLWVETLCGGWTCVRDGGPRVLDVRDCRACPRWDPLLTTRRRANQTTLSPEFPEPPVHTGTGSTETRSK